MSSDHLRPRVDVLLPVYNGAATIEESVRSTLNQTIAEVRVIVVDDGSTDATPQVLDGLARHDARVMVLRQPNSGIVDALNLGLAHAQAPYVARQDGDDRSAPDRFARQVAFLESNPDVVAVSGRCTYINQDGHPTGAESTPPDPDLADYRSLPAVEPYLPHPFLMVRREAFQAVGGYRYVYHAEDSDLYWRLRRIGRLANLPALMGEMRLHDASVSSASVVNGRIMAVSSQLAAISAKRIDEGRSDIPFPRSALAQYKAAQSLEGMIAIAGDMLDADELRYLRDAVAVELMVLALGKPYELDVGDCRFIRAQYAALDPAALRGRVVANWVYRATLARLLRKRLLPEALALSSVPVLCRAVAGRFSG